VLIPFRLLAAIVLLGSACSPPPGEQAVTVVAVGDVQLGRGVGAAIA